MGGVEEFEKYNTTKFNQSRLLNGQLHFDSNSLRDAALSTQEYKGVTQLLKVKFQFLCHEFYSLK